jgi:hypothetical protein
MLRPYLRAAWYRQALIAGPARLTSSAREVAFAWPAFSSRPAVGRCAHPRVTDAPSESAPLASRDRRPTPALGDSREVGARTEHAIFTRNLLVNEIRDHMLHLPPRYPAHAVLRHHGTPEGGARVWRRLLRFNETGAGVLPRAAAIHPRSESAGTLRCACPV